MPLRLPHPVRRSTALFTLTAGLALAQATCELPTGDLPDRSRYVMLLDTSGSMVGQGDGKVDIFARVKSELGRFLQETTGASTVRLVTFSDGVKVSKDFNYPEQRAALQTYLGTLKATGDNTYLYRSMQQVFSGLQKDAQLATTVYVLTDGQDNDPKPVNLKDALASFETQRGQFDKLYYLGLGTEIPQTAKTAFGATPYARTVEVPAEEIPQLGGLGLLPALLELSSGKFSRTSKVGEDVKLTLDAARYPGLSVENEQLSAGDGTLGLKTDGTAAGSDAAALLCVNGETLSETALVRPGKAASTPAAAPDLQLQLINPEADRTLAPGEETTLNYRLNGTAGESGQVAFDDLPGGLEATVNGEALSGPVSATVGDTIALTLRNAALPEGQAVQIAPTLDGTPAQAQVVTLGTGNRSSDTPAAASRLVLLNPEAARTLAPGEETTLNYRLEGTAGERGQVAFNDLPTGLEATVNGDPLSGPLAVTVGDTIALTLRNAALPEGQAVQIAPTLDGTPAQEVTLGTGNASTDTPAAASRLVLLNPEADRTLALGEETTLNYRLEGTAGERGQVAFNGLPTGLEATVNGAALRSPLAVTVGDTVALTLRNAALPEGQAVRIAPSLDGIPAQTQVVTLGTETAASPPTPASRLVLLNPEADRMLRPGESAVLRYRAEGAPANVKLNAAPDGTTVAFEGESGESLAVATGSEFGVRVTNTGLGERQVAPTLQLASGEAVRLPTVTGEQAGFPWDWLGLLGLLGLFGLAARRVVQAVSTVPPVVSRPVVTPPVTPPVAPATPFVPSTPIRTEVIQTGPVVPLTAAVHAVSAQHGQISLHGEDLLITKPFRDLEEDLGQLFEIPGLMGLRLKRSGAGAQVLAVPTTVHLLGDGATALPTGTTLLPGRQYPLRHL